MAPDGQQEMLRSNTIRRYDFTMLTMNDLFAFENLNL